MAPREIVDAKNQGVFRLRWGQRVERTHGCHQLFAGSQHGGEVFAACGGSWAFVAASGADDG